MARKEFSIVKEESSPSLKTKGSPDIIKSKFERDMIEPLDEVIDEINEQE